ncbi:MAG TPA: glycerol-3-phosphate 1-O-acyltransferase PlsY, partial [Gammaproteobacteria bacterium]|nr:glycerol-3-phosphate 1-O-acyltransferase PlsY [Gammaproteobacteria bacterium]
LIVFAYLSGSLCSAIIVCRLLRLADPRTSGSGNPGATNVLRLHGAKVAALALAGDVLKGVVPVFAAKYLEAPQYVIAICGLCAFLGHLYPLYFRFQGGKGVATFLGVIAATDWLLGLGFIVTWLVTAAVFRYSSLASITASILTLLFTWLVTGSPVYLLCYLSMVIALLLRHRANLSKLLDGTERKIGEKRT